MNSKKIRKLAAWAIGFLVLLYVGYQFYAVQNKGVTTETVMYATVSDVLQTEGLAIRQETVIRGNYQGVLSYCVDDGKRVAEGGVIAEIYRNEGDAAARNRINLLDQKIQNLEILTGSADHYVSNPSLLNTQIYTSLSDIQAESQKGNYTELPALRENLLTALNRRQLITEEESAGSYQQRLASVREEREALAASSGERVDTVTAPVSGYFVSVVDGFEAAVDLEKALQLTPSEIRKLQQQKSGGTGEGEIGKICREFKWYLACVFSENDMIKFEEVSEVALDIPFAGSSQIPAKVAAKNPDPATGETAVIFECSYMDAGIAMLRDERVQITVRTYSGVLVKKEALHFADVEYTVYDDDGNATSTQVAKDVMGVYVEYGDRLKFVQIFSEKTVNGYAICKIQLDEEEQEALVTDATIQLYDEVVTEGTDLYDGKLVR